MTSLVFIFWEHHKEHINMENFPPLNLFLIVKESFN